MSASTSTATKRKRSAPPSHDNNNDNSSTGQSSVSLEALISPNMDEFARQFPDLGRAWYQLRQARHSMHDDDDEVDDFQVHETFSRQLTQALLKVHFGLSLVHIPCQSSHHHLCPPVPNRFFYVQWIQQHVLPLGRDDSYFHSSDDDPDDYNHYAEVVTGLDIGTGATCIYPLLWVANCKYDGSKQQRQQQSCCMYATDVDPESVHMAQQNVQANGMESCIRVVQVPPCTSQQQQAAAASAAGAPTPSSSTSYNLHKGPLWTSLEHCLSPPRTEHNNSSSRQQQQQQQLDFCMTNPPFFDDDNRPERTSRRAGDQRQRTAMTATEGSYPGGEVGFVRDMIVDGLLLHLQQQQQQQQSHALPVPPTWSSCMCGKKESWIRLQHILQQLLGYAHVCSTEFGPGHMTRWFLAWTFSLRPCIRSPLAVSDTWTFVVQQQQSTDDVPDCDKVVRRIQTYVHESFPQRHLQVVIVPSTTAAAAGQQQQLLIQETWHDMHGTETATASTAHWIGDEALPESLQQIIQHQMSPAQRAHFLPPQGHFQMRVSFTCPATTTPPVVVGVVVQMDAVSHTRHGKLTVDKIKLQMPGEIGRTNRKWRRKLQQQQKQQELFVGSHRMDES